MKRKIPDIFTIEFLEGEVKRCEKNAKRQRRKLIDIQGTGRDVRIRPQYWEQVANDFKNIIKRLNPGENGEVCECGGKGYFLAPIVNARCADCRRPLPNRPRK